MPRHLPGVLTATALALAVLTGCAADWSVPHDGPLAEGALAPGFLAADVSPSPEATIVPQAGSWEQITPRAGYRVVLVTSGDDAATRTLTQAVRNWADVQDADLRTVEPEQPTDLVDGIVAAIGMGADLVISVGDALVDPMTVVTASHLDQQFLVLGAEIAEPTANVTAVDWTGASYRGEGLVTSSDPDPSTFTAQRCATAVRAGVGSVLGGVTGVVVWID